MQPPTTPVPPTTPSSSTDSTAPSSPSHHRLLNRPPAMSPGSGARRRLRPEGGQGGHDEPVRPPRRSRPHDRRLGRVRPHLLGRIPRGQEGRARVHQEELEGDRRLPRCPTRPHEHWGQSASNPQILPRRPPDIGRPGERVTGPWRGCLRRRYGDVRGGRA